MAFLEEYTLLDELGQGGYATVYKVKHNKLGYIRAIRVLNTVIARGESDKTYQKFIEECRILLRLGNGSHPNIVHIYQPLLKAQKAIVEMDYVDGKDLYHYIESQGKFVQIKDVIRLLTDISSALSYCHEDIYKFCMDKEEDNLKDDPEDGQKVLLDESTIEKLINKYRVIHNDIHSANIIRREDGRYVLLDFGLAIEGDSVIRSSKRNNGAPEFKAPEKWDNEKILSTQSDIYSFGIVLYEFLTGQVPFKFDKSNSNTVEAEYLLGKAHKEQLPPSIYDMRKSAYEETHPGEIYEKDYPDWLEELILKSLSKNPEDRFSNGKELYSFVMDHLEKEDIDINGEIYSLKKENIGLLGQIEHITEDKNILQLKNDKLQEDNNRLQKEKDKLQKESNNRKVEEEDKKANIWRPLFIIALIFLIIGVAYGVNKIQSYKEEETMRMQEKSQEISDLLEQISTKDAEIDELKSNPKTTNDQAYTLMKKQISAKDAEIKDLNNQISAKDAEIKDLNNQISANDKEIKKLKQEKSDLEKKLKTATNSKEITNLKNQIKEKDATIKNLNKQISTKNTEITDLRNQVADLIGL